MALDVGKISCRSPKFVPVRIAGRKQPWCVSVPPAMSETGSRECRFFSTKVEAQTFTEHTRNRARNHGVATHGLSSNQREIAANAFRLLGDKPPSYLLDVVRGHLERTRDQDRSVTFSQLREAFLTAKTKRSPAYNRQMRAAFAKLSQLNETNISVVEPTDIDHELEELPAAARNAHLRVIKAAFNFASKKGWVKTNPATLVDLSEIKRGEVEVLTNHEVSALVTACGQEDPELLPYHLFGIFAGVRPQELERMKWEHVHLEEGHILLPADITKTGTRRVIEIDPTLSQWLRWYFSRYGIQNGSIVPATNLRRRLRAIRNTAGISHWVQDVMRHTYASNWLAVNESVDKLRVNLGHRSNDVLWRHYHKAVLRKAAERFWQIKPDSEAKNHCNPCPETQVEQSGEKVVGIQNLLYVETPTCGRRFNNVLPLDLLVDRKI